MTNRRKKIKVMLSLLGFVLLLGEVSPIHVMKGVGVEDTITKSELSSFRMPLATAKSIMVWNRTYGGAGNDNFYAAIQTTDGGFALAGRTQPSGGATISHHITCPRPSVRRVLDRVDIPPGLGALAATGLPLAVDGHDLAGFSGDAIPVSSQLRNSLFPAILC